MRTEPLGTDVIERYLRTCKVRYFRGRHDAEYFFLLTLGHERLHVHVEISPADPDVFTTRVTPSYYFAAADRPRLAALADTWNRDGQWATVRLQDSADPMRIGVVVEKSHPVTKALAVEDFAKFADQTIGSAVQFFTELTAAVAVPAGQDILLQAG